MNETEIYAKLTDIFHEMFANDDIVLTSETTANDIDGWDSFNHLSIIVAIETRFGVKIGTNEIESLSNVGALVAVIQNKLAAK